MAESQSTGTQRLAHTISNREKAFIDGPVVFGWQGVQRTKAQTLAGRKKLKCFMTVEMSVYTQGCIEVASALSRVSKSEGSLLADTGRSSPQLNQVFFLTGTPKIEELSTHVCSIFP